MLLYLLKKSTANESRFVNADNRAHNCQNDDSETKKKKALFRRRKFDILIRLKVCLRRMFFII